MPWVLGRSFVVRILLWLCTEDTEALVIGLLRACELLEPECLVLMLKAVKHLSMSSTLLDVLQNANAIEILIKILEEQSSGPHSTVRLRRNNLALFGSLLLRKCQITSSKRATIYAASTNQDKKKQPKLESSPVLNVSSRPARH